MKNAIFLLFFFFLYLGRYINHPVPGLFESNCYFVVDRARPSGRKCVMLITKKLHTIFPGMELFVSYSCDTGDQAPDYFRSHGVTPLTREAVRNRFDQIFGSLKLNTNLRHSSINCGPEVARYVERAKEVIEEQKKQKRRKAKIAYNKKKKSSLCN